MEISFSDRTKPDPRRMADLTIALQEVAVEYGFAVQNNQTVTAEDGAFPKLHLTFVQFEEPPAYRTRSRTRSEIRRNFGVE